MNFTVYKPLKGHDEDAPPYADDKILVVCDGLGGGGQNRYLYEGECHTSAYLGSRKLSDIFKKYCLNHYDEICENMKNPCEIIEDLKENIKESLTKFVMTNRFCNKVKGKSMQMLPSTLASAVYKITEECVEVLIISAGDSRAYVLTPDKGLQQLSIDDVADGMDAYSKSATMTNNIREGDEFHINYAYYQLPKDCILFVASDGCFDYISTPMEWEYILESMILSCQYGFEAEENILGKNIGEFLEKRVLKDDCTIAGMISGFSNFEKMRQDFFNRGNSLKENFIIPFQELEKETNGMKTNAKSEIDKLEKNISNINTNIYNILKNEIKKCIAVDIKYPNQCYYSVPKMLKDRLNESEIYRDIFSLIDNEDKKRKKTSQEKTLEFTQKENQLRNIFNIIEIERYMSGITKKKVKSFYPEHDQLIQIISNGQEAEEKYFQAEEDFGKSFSDFKNAVSKNLSEVFECMFKMTISFAKMITVYQDFCSSKKKAENAKNELSNIYGKSSDIQKAFTKAWKNKFQDYRLFENYFEIDEIYRCCIGLQNLIENNKPLSEEEKTKIASDCLKSNMDKLIDWLKQEDILKYFCSKDYQKLRELSENLEEQKQKLNASDYKKRELWAKYKKTYERFADSDIKGMV